MTYASRVRISSSVANVIEIPKTTVKTASQAARAVLGLRIESFARVIILHLHFPTRDLGSPKHSQSTCCSNLWPTGDSGIRAGTGSSISSYARAACGVLPCVAPRGAGLRPLLRRSMAPVAEPVLAGGLDGPLDARSSLAVAQSRNVRSTLIAAAQITEQLPELRTRRTFASIGVVSIHRHDRSPPRAVFHPVGGADIPGKQSVTLRFSPDVEPRGVLDRWAP